MDNPDPDLSRLLENNEAPSKATIAQVKELLEEPIKELRSIQAEIRRLDKLLEDLKEKERTTQKAINAYNRILSPARRIPPEMWNEIFYHCLPTHRNPIMSTSEAPLLLTRVCSTWRSAALSSPHLWARLHIPFPCESPYATEDNSEQYLEMRRQDFGRVATLRSEAAKDWLSRSGNCPISLSVFYFGLEREPFGPISQWEAQILLGIFNAILPFAARWIDVELSMPLDIYQKLDAMLSVDMIPMLRIFRASLHQRNAEEYSWNTAVLWKAPNLRKMSLYGLKSASTFTENILSLTYLCLYSSISQNQALMLFEKFPNLVHCKFTIIESMDEVFTPPSSTVSLPHLQSLCIEDLGSINFSTAFFRSISAPNLRWIDYQRRPLFRRQEDMDIPSPILSLIEKSTSIVKLTFEPRELSARDISESFRLAPLIRHLVLGPEPHKPSRTLREHPDAGLVHVFDLNTLAVKATREETLLPDLEIFEASFAKTIMAEDLLKFIIGRLDPEASRRGIVVLKRVRVTFNTQRETDIAADVDRHAKAAGIDFKLELTYRPGASSTTDPLSTSFGLAEDGRSWDLPDIDEASVLAL